ncbi:Neuronal PAS domain-containing protein 2 [Armadillidium vulgare]|nr:Neuronal PAS domain-containing protein 2 [Armadillidium vulgare]
MTLSRSGRILYTSESITPLLGHIPSEMSGCCLCDFMPAEEQEDMRRFLSNPALVPGIESCPEDYTERYSIAIHVQRGRSSTSASISSPPTYERIHLTGYFERYKCPSEGTNICLIVFVAIARLEHPLLLREMIILEPTKSEFTSRHSLEWKFLFLDHRAPTIIGYLPFEVLGTSGYDYYHVDDLESVSQCHEILMKKGKGSSCFYRFLTKGQQWIWLKSHYYITYHQWNSKPEFIVCTNTVVSYNSIRNSTNKKEKDDVESEIKSQNESKSNSELLPTLHEASSSKDETDFLAGPSKLPSHCQTYPQQEQEQQEKCQISQRRNTVNSGSNQGKAYQRFPLTRRQYQSQKLQLGREKSVRQSQHQQQVDSSPGSPSSQHSHHSAYSYPLVQNTESSGEPPPWSRRTKSGKKKTFAQAVDIHGELSQSLLSSHISKEYDAKELVHCFPPSTSTDASSSCFTASSSRLLSPSNVTNANISGSTNPSQIIQSSMTQPAPVVQVAAVPLTSVIPVQPVVTNNLVRFTNPSSTEDLQHSIIMSYEQQQLQEQLKRKHSELQQHIMRQQEELRKVNEQLIMAQYGVNVQSLKEDVSNVTTYNRGENPSSSSSSYDLNIAGGGISSNLRNTPLSVVPLHTGVTMSSSRASLSQHQHYVSSSSSLNEQAPLSVSSNIGISSLQAIGVQGVAVPYQLPQQQAQMLFTNQRQGNNSYHENQHRQRQSQQPPQ